MFKKCTHPLARTLARTVLAVGLILGLLGLGQAVWAGNIDLANRFAWSTNAGWINFGPSPTSGSVQPVTVYADHLEGYAWGENVGWIRLGTHTGGSPHTYANTTKVNYGVNFDPLTGNLSGYAWGTSVGWINFGPVNGGPVTIDLETGDFSGCAWGENVGWICLSGTAQDEEAYRVSAADFPAFELGIDKTVSASTLFTGETVTYTVVVSNSGGIDVSGGTISDTLPAGVSWVDGSALLKPSSAGTLGSPPQLVSGLTIAAGTSVTLTYQVTVIGDLRMITNTASVTTTQLITPVDATAFFKLAPLLTVNKVVVGGTLGVEDFPLFVNGDPVTSGVANGLAAGSYVVSETSVPSYSAAFSGDCDSGGNVTLAIGEQLTCTLTNTYIPQSLTVKKVVVGGSLGVKDFPLFISGDAVNSGVANGLAAGSYVVSETNVPSYTPTFSGDCDSDGDVTLGIGGQLTCTLTNTYIPQSLTVKKVVVGGPLGVEDFPIFVNGDPVTSGVANGLPAGSYVVSETSVPSYSAIFSGDCDSEGKVTLAIGEQLTCTLTNAYKSGSAKQDIYLPVIVR